MAKLAIKGGSPLRTKKFPEWPQYGENEQEALERVLKSGVWGTLGEEVDKFSKRFASYQNANYGVCVTNGTVTMETILRALDIGCGDEVIIPPYTFNATASSVIYVGATPVFVDIESRTYNIDVNKIEAAITPKTKAIIPVHVTGRTCDMDMIVEIARKHKLYIVEDCAHAHGSEWKGKRVGSIGDAGSFSFQASKNLTAGEGGFITVNDIELYEKCWSIHNCGRSFSGTIWYDHPNIGTNARMTEWQAAILDSQMNKLDEQIEKRMQNADYLTSGLNKIQCIETLLTDSRVTRNSHHGFVFKFINEKCKGLSRETFIKALRAEGIPCSAGYVPLYKQSLLQGEDMKKRTGSKIEYDKVFLKNTEDAAREGIWLGQNMLLSEKEDMDEILLGIVKVYENVDEVL